MGHQWRPGPAQGNICPVCSISHFPFCPAHPSFNHQYPRFPSHPDHYRPGLDPYQRPLAANPPYTGNPNDGFGDQRAWHRSPSFERDSLGQFPLQSMYDYGSNGYTGEVDRSFKRPRVDEIGSGFGPFTNESCQNPESISLADERRLRLIRDHGGASSGAILEPGTKAGYNSERDFEGNYRPGSVEHGNFDDFRGGRGDFVPMPPRNKEMNNFQDPGYGPLDGRGPFLRREVHGLPFGRPDIQNRFQSNINGGTFDKVGGSQNEEFPLSRYGQDESSMHHQTHGPNNANQQVHIAHQIQPKHSIPTKEPQYSHMNNWQDHQSPQPYRFQHPNFVRHDYHSPGNLSDARFPLEAKYASQDDNQGPVRHQNLPGVAQSRAPNLNERGGLLPRHADSSLIPENKGQMEASRVFGGQPPLPTSPPPPLPVEPPVHLSSEFKAFFSPPKTSFSLFPVPYSSSAMVSSSYQPIPEAHSLTRTYFHNKALPHASTGFMEESQSQAFHRTSSMQYLGESRSFPPKQLSVDKPKVIDATQLFKQPQRAARPDHIVIILRGLPGSGKSYLAKILRGLEVENGGDAPRIHSMDDYFMTEVEKVEESDASKSSSSVRGKKPMMKKVMEYCYEPEMEEAYRSSMLKAFKRTLEEGIFTFIIVDDRNLRVADFAQFWAIAKRSGYEVYILEATYKDPAGCAARNVHGFTLDEIQKMAGQWEEAPSLYLQLDIKSLFHGDDLKESGIQEVDMDVEDGDFDEGLSGLQERRPEKSIVLPVGDDSPNDPSKDGKRWDAEGDHPTEEVKELGRSKWSDDLDVEDTERFEGVKGNLNALSGLINAYRKEGKSVRWADQVGNTGFSIGAVKKANMLSLVIGEGAGYNLKSNPLPEEESPTTAQSTGKSMTQSMFQEQLRAERESFKAVFDRRRQRIGGLDVEEE